MFLRIFSASLCALALAGCDGVVTSPEPEGNTVDCAIGPGSEYANVCTVERLSDTEIVIHHPNGGFRRLLTNDGGVQSADGSDEVKFTQDPVTGDFEVFVAEDRYYLLVNIVLTD